MIDEAEPGSQAVLTVVNTFLEALDANDFSGAGHCLEPDCSYETEMGNLRGKNEVLAMYAVGNLWARKNFDDVRDERTIKQLVGSSAIVSYAAYMVKAGGHFHRYTCRQEIRVSVSGLISHLILIETPAERAALEAFCHACGVVL